MCVQSAPTSQEAKEEPWVERQALTTAGPWSLEPEAANTQGAAWAPSIGQIDLKQIK